MRYLAGWRPFLIIMVVSMLVNILLTPAFSLIPILVTRHLEGQAFQLAWLDTAVGVGIVVGGLTLSAWGGFKRRTVTMLCGLIGIGAGCMIVGWTPARAIPMAIVGTLVIGFFLPLCDGPFIAILQSTVEPSMQGRVFSLVGAASKLATPLSLAVAGPISDRFGVPLWFSAAGAVCVALGLVVMAMPTVLNMESQRPTEWRVTEAEGKLEPATAVVE
jgi:DHA3 family macrolide efflux protein-like MFS transporter